MSDEEFANFVDKSTPELKEEIKFIFQKSIDEIKYQLNLIETNFSSYTQRNGVIMTVIGLVSFLPSLGNFGVTYLKVFLLWTFPFLLASLFMYYLASVRPSALMTQMPLFKQGSKEELLVLKANMKAYTEVWKKYKNIHDEVQGKYRWVSSFSYMYLISFSSNFYIFTFSGEPRCISSILIFLGTILVGVSIVFRHKLKSLKNLSFGPHFIK